MTTLIPTRDAFVARKTPGEQRPAERLEQTHDATLLNASQLDGNAWGEVAVRRADWNITDLCAAALRQRKLSFNPRKHPDDYILAADAIQIVTIKVSKGLEFPVAALPGVGYMPAKGENEQEAARVFYVAMTRATQSSILGKVGKEFLVQSGAELRKCN